MKFLLRSFLEIRWEQKLIMDSSTILSMVAENLHFLDSLNSLPKSLKSMPNSFDLTCKKGYYPHFFNTASDLNYVGSYPKTEYLGADFMSGDNCAQFFGMARGAKR